MSEINLDSNNCFVCGPNNDIGLKIEFIIGDDDICRAEFTPRKSHVGFQNTTHGGIIFSLLDDVMANWLFLKGQPAQTAKCDLRYKNSLQTGETVLLEGHHLKTKSASTGDLIVDSQKCQRGDLNSRPQGYESCALTS